MNNLLLEEKCNENKFHYVNKLLSKADICKKKIQAIFTSGLSINDKKENCENEIQKFKMYLSGDNFLSVYNSFIGTDDLKNICDFMIKDVSRYFMALYKSKELIDSNLYEQVFSYLLFKGKSELQESENIDDETWITIEDIVDKVKKGSSVEEVDWGSLSKLKTGKFSKEDIGRLAGIIFRNIKTKKASSISLFIRKIIGFVSKKIFSPMGKKIILLCMTLLVSLSMFFPFTMQKIDTVPLMKIKEIKKDISSDKVSKEISASDYNSYQENIKNLFRKANKSIPNQDMYNTNYNVVVLSKDIVGAINSKIGYMSGKINDGRDVEKVDDILRYNILKELNQYKFSQGNFYPSEELTMSYELLSQLSWFLSTDTFQILQLSISDKKSYDLALDQYREMLTNILETSEKLVKKLGSIDFEKNDYSGYILKKYEVSESSFSEIAKNLSFLFSDLNVTSTTAYVPYNPLGEKNFSIIKFYIDNFPDKSLENKKVNETLNEIYNLLEELRDSNTFRPGNSEYIIQRIKEKDKGFIKLFKSTIGKNLDRIQFSDLSLVKNNLKYNFYSKYENSLKDKKSLDWTVKEYNANNGHKILVDVVDSAMQVIYKYQDLNSAIKDLSESLEKSIGNILI